MSKEGPIKRLRKSFGSLTLQTKLIIMMLCLLFSSLAVYLYFQTMTENALRKQVEDEMVDLSTAIQISVEELTTQGVTDEARLRDYVKKMKRKGFKEISILSKKKRVIASSNPLMKGATLDIVHKEPDKD
jgi:sensor histidine kinase regulating citrate/malate metabolism